MLLGSLGNHLGVTWVTLGPHLGVTRASLGRNLGVTWVSIGCHLGVTWVTLGRHEGVTWVSLWCHLGITLVSLWSLLSDYWQTITLSRGQQMAIFPTKGPHHSKFVEKNCINFRSKKKRDDLQNHYRQTRSLRQDTTLLFCCESAGHIKL